MYQNTICTKQTAAEPKVSFPHTLKDYVSCPAEHYAAVRFVQVEERGVKTCRP